MVGDENPPEVNDYNYLNGIETKENVEEIQRFRFSGVSRSLGFSAPFGAVAS